MRSNARIGFGAAALGVVAGMLLPFGLVVLLFEVAESGQNTRLWQALLGWVLPVVLLAGVLLARSRGTTRWPLWHLVVATVAGLAVGIAGLVVTAMLS